MPSSPPFAPAAYTAPVLFISDLHLSPGMPHTTAAFESFLQTVAPSAQALFILGDFFEYWLGDDVLQAPNSDVSGKFSRHIATQLLSLNEQGTQVFLMHGNRDFLIGQQFAQAAQLTLLPDPWVLEAHGQRIALTHGDLLCTTDLAYQRFRYWVRRPWLQAAFLALPLRLRLRVAERMRHRSRIRHQHPIHFWVDTEDTAIQHMLDATDCTHLIHGHTHLPATHPLPDGERLVLSDWDFDGHPDTARGNYLQLDADGLHTRSLINTS